MVGNKGMGKGIIKLKKVEGSGEEKEEGRIGGGFRRKREVMTCTDTQTQEQDRCEITY